MKTGEQHRWEVSYREGSFHRGNSPVFLRAAEYQYYRDRAENWQERIRQIQESDANAITFYIPWRHHMPDPSVDRPDFSGDQKKNRDLPRFIHLIEDAGLLAIAKPGPFVHSELNIGGLPDWVSPSGGAETGEAMQRWDGSPLIWEYDRSILPAPYAEPFLDHARRWLAAVAEVLRPFTAPRGPLVAIQINDETLYCASNAPPWMMGYESSTLNRYRGETGEPLIDRWLAGGAPQTALSWDFPDEAPDREELENRIAWGRYQGWIRGDTYRLYREALGLELPYLSNYAGMTPPIEENVPQRDAVTLHETTSPFAPLAPRYADWWIAHNPIEVDREIYHYGFISWLGVTPYNISDPRTVDANHPVVPNTVFSRYINTATRGRGINMEENWGFATLYHPYSQYPFVPIFQTLVSIAGGATGFVVFCAVSHDYWDETLDSTTKKQHPHFPSAAPIGPDGELREMYHSMRHLNRWFAEHGDSLVGSLRQEDLCFGVYQRYSAIASWCERWPAMDIPPLQGHLGLETLSNSAQEVGYVPAWIGLDGQQRIDPVVHPRLVVILWRMMDPTVQRLLSSYVDEGGQLYWIGEIPGQDWDGRPCTILNDCISRNGARATRLTRMVTDPDATPQEVAAELIRAGLPARYPVEPGGRILTFQGTTNDGSPEQFIFFFTYDQHTDHRFLIGETTISVDAGGKCCGVLRLESGVLVDWYIKGTNEVENTSAVVTVGSAGLTRTFAGDCWSTAEAGNLSPVLGLHTE